MKRRTSFPLISAGFVMALAGWLVMAAPAVWAQQRPAPQPAPQPQIAQPARAASQGPLDERIIRLEQRILDLQTVIGTLQTFVRDGGGVPSQGGFPPAAGEGLPGGGIIGPGGAPSELSIRVLALETQIKAVTTQMEQIASRLDQGNPAAGAPLQQGGLLLPGGQPVPQGQPFGAPVAGGPLGQSPPPLASDPVLGRDSQPGLPGFSTNTAGLPTQNPFSDPGPLPQGQAGLPSPPLFPPPVIPQPAVPQPAITPLAVSPPVIPGAGGGARAVYDASYENFLRNDFQRAGSGFQSFVKSFPDDQLTSNAYYWLGRTHYARRQYEPAAKAFLSGYKKDKKNSIAADALLHLGMSLGAMGEKEAACSTLGAISKQFPNAAPTLKQDVGKQLKSTGCKG